MKILVDVKNAKAGFLIEILSHLSFVKKAEIVKRKKSSKNSAKS